MESPILINILQDGFERRPSEGLLHLAYFDVRHSLIILSEQRIRSEDVIASDIRL